MLRVSCVNTFVSPTINREDVMRFGLKDMTVTVVPKLRLQSAFHTALSHLIKTILNTYKLNDNN